MQPLNNDMDHLMRQAADAFEVPPTGANWQKVAAELDADATVAKQSTAWMHSLRCGLLLIFLLTSLVCNKYLYMPYNRLGFEMKNANSVVNNNENNSNNHVTKTSGDLEFNRTNTNETIEIASVQNQFSQNATKPFYNTNITKEFKIGEAETNNIKAPEEPSSRLRISSFEKITNIQLPNIENFKTSEIPFVNAAPFIEDDILPNHLENNPKRKNRRLYFGVVAGPDISTVKFEESSEVGFTAGIIAGYQLNKNWSIESGLLWNKKNYYTQGKHFNTSKLKLPSHTNIIYAEGYCNMFEIPLNIRYQFAHNKKHHWFAAAGTSSYLMQKEDYHYLYERYNVTYYSSKSYKSASRNWFSVANISAGYEFEKKNGMAIRIEPYLKIPIRGMGIGSLPITSTGIQVGITYPVK